MDEIIVRVARAVASMPRLRVLSYLAQHGEVTPTEMGTELGISLNTLSVHLRILSTTGLIRSRKSGARCFYGFVSPYGEQTLSGSISRWLSGLLKQAAQSNEYHGPREVRDHTALTCEGSLHALVFDAATAFTDLRRLQILRYLEMDCQATVPDLRDNLSMSEGAVSRHTAKLRRRGFVGESLREGGGLSFTLAPVYKSPVHERMHQIVRSFWQPSLSRTSRSPR